MRIAVAGGTGVVGARTVDMVRELGHEPLVLARSTGVDLTSATHLERSLEGIHAVIDVTSISTQSAKRSTEFFEAVTSTLLAAERTAGVPHHVALSIVGSDRAPAGYYAGKARQEQLVRAGGVPWSVLRATQFHEFAPQILGRMSAGPIAVIPKMRCMPVAAREVAEHLVALAVGAPVGDAPDLAGPREESMMAMVRAYVAALGVRRALVEIAVPGVFGTALRDGTLLPAAAAVHGVQTFDEWLEGAKAARSG